LNTADKRACACVHIEQEEAFFFLYTHAQARLSAVFYHRANSCTPPLVSACKNGPRARFAALDQAAPDLPRTSVFGRKPALPVGIIPGHAWPKAGWPRTGFPGRLPRLPVWRKAAAVKNSLQEGSLFLNVRACCASA
jgi:hypothetical protein